LSKKRKAQVPLIQNYAGQIPGRLILVSLGIGNAQDVSLRALEALKTATTVLAEDTREILKFYRIHDIKVPKLVSYRDQNHVRMLPQVLTMLRAGENLLLVSDRGTPAISDPGFLLVRDVVAAGFEVDSLPGPAALIDALVLSGLPTDRFAFLGFLPRTASKQRKLLEQYLPIATTLIMYESPFRITALLDSVSQVFGQAAKVVVARELTKQYQQLLRGVVADLYTQIKATPVKGECVVLVDTRLPV